MRDLDAINRRWGARHAVTLLMQYISLAVGTSQLIYELNVCSASDKHILECKSLTIWQHVATGVVLLNIFLDFYGMCFCVLITY